MSPRINKDRKETFTPKVDVAPPSIVATIPPADAGPSLAKPTKPAQHLYFVNAFVDYGIIGLGSIILYAIFMLVLSTEQKVNGSNFTNMMGIIAGWLVFACNYPHFAATNYRLYHSKANMMQYPITALVIPWVIIALLIGSYLSPTIIAPIFVKIYLVWSPYHFSGQTLGISLIYFRRAGVMVGKWERFALSNFIYSTFLYSTAKGEVASSASDISITPFFGVEMSRLCLPGWVPDVVLVWMAINACLLLFLVGRWCVQNGRVIPPIVLLPAITQFVWFVPGNYLAAFNYMVPFFHSLQYLLIAWSMQLKEKMDRENIQPSVRYVVGETMRWGGINMVVGWLLFFGLPVLISVLGGGTNASLEWLHGFIPWLYLPQTGTGIGLQFSIGVFISAVQIHHFFVDGVIWKLKRTTVSSPLMVNLDEMIHAGPSEKKV